MLLNNNEADVKKVYLIMPKGTKSEGLNEYKQLDKLSIGPVVLEIAS